MGRLRTGTAQWPGWGSCPRPRAGDGRRRPRKGTWGEGGPGQGAHRSGPHLSHCNGVQHPHTWLPVGTEGTVFLVTSCRGGGTGRRLQVQSPPALSPAGLLPPGAVRRHPTPARPGLPTPALPLAEGPCGWPPPQLSRTLRTAGPWPCPVPHFEFGDVWASVGVSSRNTVALTPETKRGPAPSRGHSVLHPGPSERGPRGCRVGVLRSPETQQPPLPLHFLPRCPPCLVDRMVDGLQACAPTSPPARRMVERAHPREGRL